MYIIRLDSMCNRRCWESWNARGGHLPESQWNRAARSGWDELAIVKEVNNFYPIVLKVMTLRLLVWMDNGVHTKLTHQELVERLKKGIKAALMI